MDSDLRLSLKLAFALLPLSSLDCRSEVFVEPDEMAGLFEDIQGFDRRRLERERAAGEMLGQEQQGDPEARYHAGLNARELFLREAGRCPGFEESVKAMTGLHRSGESLSAKDIKMAISTTYFESSDDYAEQQAVAWVILNRWREGLTGNAWATGDRSVYAVCTQKTGSNNKNPTGWQFEAQIWISGPAKDRRELVCGEKLRNVQSALRSVLVASSSDRWGPWAVAHAQKGFLYYCRGKLPGGRLTWSSPPLDASHPAPLIGFQYFLENNECRLPRLAKKGRGR